MKILHYNSISIIIFLIYISYSFLPTTINSFNLSSEEDFKNDQQEISKTKIKSKIVACMSLVRNSLAEENKNLKFALDNSKFDRSKSFDKLIIAMITNCEKKITDKEIEYLLNPENILSPVSVNERYSQLIKFDKNILRDLEKIEFSPEEILIQKEIDEAMQIIDADFAFQEEDIGILGIKFSEFGNSFYIVLGLIVIMSVIILAGGLYVILCKKKIVKERKKKNN